MRKKEFGIYLKYLRNRQKMPLRQLSKLIGISYTHLSNIENGRRTPPEHDKLITISNILETTEVEKQHLLELAEQSKMIVHGIPCEISI